MGSQLWGLSLARELKPGVGVRSWVLGSMAQTPWLCLGPWPWAHSIALKVFFFLVVVLENMGTVRAVCLLTFRYFLGWPQTIPGAM